MNSERRQRIRDVVQTIKEAHAIMLQITDGAKPNESYYFDEDNDAVLLELREETDSCFSSLVELLTDVAERNASAVTPQKEIKTEEVKKELRPTKPTREKKKAAKLAAMSEWERKEYEEKKKATRSTIVICVIIVILMILFKYTFLN